ncbi:hypothetical protein J2W42_000149 [Rhizobium tibeticum]|uniref:Uncharacterized protein n=1 Tax=Rhizobium tibeticum TaxID=501024 RepID=A0A1H8EAJ7_9HYPH|nr:hypothetical protein [Rhizobium tibeticum]MDP9807318.1 hypothetical protein [Rhizobium tibeticum]SEH56080.1 hypothetical protein RTCCBAU85039_1165 [Rhizobium tibeticum]SEN15778.1 hypothetical protein SAMN05216228_1002345 [Rhizobium tibeticum]
MTRSVCAAVTASTVVSIAGGIAATSMPDVTAISSYAICLRLEEEGEDDEADHYSQDHEHFARSIGCHRDLPSVWPPQPQGNQ